MIHYSSVDAVDVPGRGAMNCWRLQNNRVDMSSVPHVKKENKEIVLSAAQDTFFRKAMYLNFGDWVPSIKELVDKYRLQMGSNKEISQYR